MATALEIATALADLAEMPKSSRETNTWYIEQHDTILRAAALLIRQFAHGVANA